MAKVKQADAFIDEANKVLEHDGYHNVRRAENGEVEMFDAEGETIISFSPTVSTYDLLGVSMLISESWLITYNETKREALREFRGMINRLKSNHGDALTAAHIDAALKEQEDWEDFFDREAEEERLAHEEQAAIHAAEKAAKGKRG